MLLAKYFSAYEPVSFDPEAGEVDESGPARCWEAGFICLSFTISEGPQEARTGGGIGSAASNAG